MLWERMPVLPIHELSSDSGNLSEVNQQANSNAGWRQGQRPTHQTTEVGDELTDVGCQESEIGNCTKPEILLPVVRDGGIYGISRIRLHPVLPEGRIHRRTKSAMEISWSHQVFRYQRSSRLQSYPGLRLLTPR